MTVIAWDGKHLAADKRCVNSQGGTRVCTKIERFDPYLLGISGSWDVGAEMREWFKAGAHPEKFPVKAREDLATLLVIQAGCVNTYNAGAYPMRIEQQKCAWGSGRDYAEAVMFLGHDARKAVEVTCHFQSDCGNGIDVLWLDEKEAP